MAKETGAVAEIDGKHTSPGNGASLIEDRNIP